MTNVYAINLPRRIAALDTGGAVPIIQMFDGQGQETDDPDKAIAFYAGAEEVGFLTGAVADFPVITIH